MTHVRPLPTPLQPIPAIARRFAAAVIVVASLAHPGPAAATKVASVRDMLTHGASDAYRSGGRAAAIAWTDSVRRTALAQGDRGLATGALLARANWHVGLGETATAVACLDTALSAATSIRDTFALCWALDGLAGVADRARDFARAKPLRQRQQRLAHAARLPEMEGLAWFGLAGVASLAGQSEDALRAARRAVALLPPSRRERMFAQNIVGLAHAALGRTDEARRVLVEALGEARERADRGAELFLLNGLGKLEYDTNDPAAALAFFEQAVDRGRASNDSVYTARAEVNRASTLGQLGRHDDAVKAMRGLMPFAERPGRVPLQIQLYANLSAELDALGRPAEALEYARKAAALGRPDDLQGYWNGHLALALLTQRVAGPAAALAVLDTAAAHAASPVLSQRVSMLVLRSELFEALGRPADALAVAREAERLTRPESAARGANWMEAVARLGHVHRAQGRPDSAAVLLRRAAAEWEKRRATIASQDAREGRGPSVARLFGELGLATLEANPSRTRERRVRDAFAAVQAFQARTLEERMHGAGVSARAVSRRVTLDSLQRRVLRPGELLLDLVATPETTLVFAVTRASVRAWGAAGLASLEPRTGALRRALESGLAESATRLACEQLGAELLGPVAPELARVRAIVVTGGGPLAALPFARLVAPGDERLLVERFDVSVAPSATLWAMERARARSAAAPGRLLAIARSTSADGAALGGAARESRGLAERYAGVTARVHAGDRALASLTGDLARFDALHLAGHSAYETSSPWRSGILLGRGSGDAAYLRASSVAKLQLPARLVVLSSCTSAASRGLPGEGLQGLASAFLCSGAAAVVATLWRVDDQVAADFSAAFYRRLAGGATVAAALRAAQLELREGRDPAGRRDWAAWTVLGDGDLRVPLARRGATAVPRTLR